MKITHASVFSGIGGPEVAASMLGWQNLFHCEINPFGRAVLDYWYPESESYEDITKTDFSKWRGKVNVLTGGFPCQPFSYSGQRRGENDDRYLWPHMFRCIDEVRPDWVVCENVAGILTMVEQGSVSEMESEKTLFGEGDDVQRYRLQETYTLERICRDLESHGYAVQPMLVPACAVGAPHRRDRVFIIAANTDARYVQDRIGDADRMGEENFRRQAGGPVHGYLQEIQGQARWRCFPSVAPVHGRDDGFPFPLDSLAIPASKWRTESLKAYGNAIVPQVMYEIFRAIEETYAVLL